MGLNAVLKVLADHAPEAQKSRSIPRS